MAACEMPDAKKILRAKLFVPTARAVPFSGTGVVRYTIMNVLTAITGCTRVSGPGIVKTVTMRPII